MFKKLSKYSLIPLGLLLSATCHAEDGRRGYSFFGAGFDFVDYEENTARNIDGKTVDIETELELKFTQHSGAYISINTDWGFYLTSSSTLGDSKSDEQWQIDDTTVRENSVSFSRQRLEGLATYRLATFEYLLFGVQYSSIDFKRFAAQLTSKAGSFGVDETSFSPGTVSENVWDVSVKIGYEINSIFHHPNPGWRYQLQVIAGIPLTTNISNTDVNDGESYSSSFEGLQLRLNGVYGYQFSENVLAAFGLELALRRRDVIIHDVISSTGITEFPENTLLYSFPSFIVLWSF